MSIIVRATPCSCHSEQSEESELLLVAQILRLRLRMTEVAAQDDGVLCRPKLGLGPIDKVSICSSASLAREQTLQCLDAELDILVV